MSLVLTEEVPGPVAVVLVGGRVLGGEALESGMDASALGAGKNGLLRFEIMEAPPPECRIGSAFQVAEVFSLA